MHRASEVILLCCLSAGVLLLGFALCFPFFSFFPLFWSAGLAAAFLPCFVICVALRRRVIPSLYFVVGLVYSVIFTWMVTTFTGVDRVEQYECNWKMDAEKVEIDLSPAGGFDWSPVSSGELTEHLRKDRPPKLLVEVPITRDFGRVRSRGMIKRVDGIPVREP
jgi:hypothetical protein